MFVPWFNYWAYVAYDRVFQAYDQKRCCPNLLPTKTNCGTVSEYFEMYVGPEYEIHFKYAELENICCLCFVFGPGIPMLYPVGLVCILGLHLIEKYSIARLYRRPPNYSSEITYSSMRNMLRAPIYYSAVGFWMFSNR